MTEKIYSGHRTEEPGSLGTTVSKIEDGVIKGLPLRLDLWNHSPGGFEWRYGGSGPAQLAVALLADATGDDLYAKALHQIFKRAIVTKLDRDQWHLSKDDVIAWVIEHPLSGDERFQWLPREQQAEIIDREVVAGMTSECCNAPCEYRASRQGGIYRTFAVCTRCGAEAEF